MALLRWLNGWRLMVVAFVVGNVAVSVWAIGGMNRCQDVVTRWTGFHPPSGNAEPFLVLLIMACSAIVAVGLIWGLVSLFVRIERSR